MIRLCFILSLLFSFIGCRTTKEISKSHTIEYITDSVYVDRAIEVSLPPDTVYINQSLEIRDTIFVDRDVLKYIYADTIRSESDYIGALAWVNKGELGVKSYFLNDTIEASFKGYLEYDKKVETIIEKEYITKWKTAWKTTIIVGIACLALGLVVSLVLPFLRP